MKTSYQMLSQFDIENSEEFKTTKNFCKTNFDIKKNKDEESRYVDLPKIYAFISEIPWYLLNGYDGTHNVIISYFKR